MKNFLIDTHCHLNLGYSPEEIPNLIENAKKLNVKYLHTICTGLNEFPEILAIVEKYNNIYCSVGLHPDNAKGDNIASVEDLIEASKHPKVISFGETGLDYYHEGFEKKAQKKSFLNHIYASQAEALPVIVHNRDSDNDVIDILQSEMKNKEFTGIIHCFTASYEFAKKAIDMGLYISIAGIVTFKNAKELQETVKKLPLDKLLVETDSPYLAPTPYRGKRNEPAYTYYTAEYMAELFSMGLEEFSSITTSNAEKIFKKAKFI